MPDIFDTLEEEKDAPVRDIFDDLDSPEPESKRDLFDDVADELGKTEPVEQPTVPRGTRRSTAPLLAKALQENKLFGSATTALEGAWDKGIRRREDGDWDLPLMMQTRDNAVLDTIGGTTTLAGQKIGARLDEAGPMIDQKAIQNVFHGFQQANNLSDEEMQSSWSDLGNINRTWKDDEKARVLSDGAILPNPQDSDWLDPQKAEALIAEASAPEESKATFRRNLPQIQAQIAADKTADYEAAASAVNQGRVPASFIGLLPEKMISPSEWAASKGRKDVGSPQFLRDYEKEVDTGGFLRGITGKLVTGNAKVANTALGIAGLLGSDTAGEMAAAGVEGTAAVNRGLPDTGIAGTVTEELPSVLAQVVTGRLLGLAGPTTATLGTYGTAGLQSAGLTYADAIAEGVPEDEAREKAVKAGISTALVTSMFGTGNAGAVERVAAGKSAEGVTLREALTAMKERGVKSAMTSEMRELAGGVVKAFAGEASEEGIDQLFQKFLTADPDQSLADAWNEAVEAFKVGGIVGAAVDVADKTVNSEAQEMALESLPDAPVSAGAALQTAADLESDDLDIGTDTRAAGATTDVPVGGEAEAGIQPDTPQLELPESEAPVVDAPGETEVESLGRDGTEQLTDGQTEIPQAADAPAALDPDSETAGPLDTEGGAQEGQEAPVASEAEPGNPLGDTGVPGAVSQGEEVLTDPLTDEVSQQPTDQAEPLAPETGVVESPVEPLPDVGTADETSVDQGAAGDLTEENPLNTSELAPAVAAGREQTDTQAVTTEVSENRANSSVGPEYDTERHSSIRNAAVDRDLEHYGFEPLMGPVAKSEQQTWDEATAAYEANPGIGRKLVDRVMGGGTIDTDVESGILLRELAERKIAQGKAQDLYFSLVNQGAAETTIAEARKELEAARESTYRAMSAARRAGTQAGRLLQSRKKFINNDDFSLAALEARYRADVNNGAPLTADQEKRIKDLSDELQKWQERADSFEQLTQEQANTIEQLTADVERAQKGNRTAALRQKLKDKIKPAVDEARARLEAKKPPTKEDGDDDIFVAHAGLAPEDVQNIKDLATVAADWLIDKSFDLAEFTARSVKAFGEWVRPYVDRAYTEGQRIFRETRASVTGAPSPEQVVEAIDTEEPLDRADVWVLARAHVIAGARGTKVLDAVFNDLAPLFPDITRDQVAELFTDYGKVVYPSQKEVPKELQRVKALERIGLKLKDVREGKMPKRTGFQRGDQDAEVRELEKQFREEYRKLEEDMRAKGVPFEDNDRRLKSALGAVKRRMQNEIEEIERALNTMVPRTDAVRTPIELDEDALNLKQRLEAKRNEYAETFDTGTTQEKRVAAVEKYLDRAIAEEEQMLRDGVLAKVKGAPVTSAAIEAKREQLAKMRQHRRDLYAAAHPETALEQAKQRARDSIERLGDMIARNDVEVRKKKPVTPDAELSALIDAREALSDQVAEMRRALPLTPAQEAAREKRMLEAAERTLRSVEQKLATNDLSVKKSVQAAVPYQVEQVRNQIKELNRQLDARRREAKVGPHSDEAKLKRYLASADSRIADYKRRIQNRDFTPRAKPEPIRADEAKNARKEINILKRKFNEMMLDDILSKRSTGRKILDISVDAALRLPRAVLASADVSGIGRQSWLLWATRPGLAMKEFPQHFKWSERAADEAEATMEQDPDYDIAKDAGLALSSWRPGHQLHEMEEAYRSRLAKKIPGVAHSERGYVTYLNSIRLSYFKALTNLLRNEPGGMTKENLKAIANHVNNMTGKGSLGNWDKGANVLADIMFSPRWVSSRFRILGGLIGRPIDAAFGFKLGPKESKLARQIILREQARMVTGVGVMATLLGFAAQAFGGDGEDDKVTFETDPRSSDFGKLKVGNRRFDFSGGMASPITFAARMATGKKVSPDGTVIELTGPDAAWNQSQAALAKQFFRAKLNPTTGSVWNVMSKEDLFGQPVYAEEEVIGNYIPLPVQEAYEAYRKSGLSEAAIASLLSFAGFANTAYGPDVSYNSSAAKDLNTGVFFPLIEKLSGGKLKVNPDRYSEDPSEPFFDE